MTINSESLQLSSRPEADALVTSQPPRRKAIRILQSIGAVLVTLCILVLLFGVPARLLFGIFLD